ncbi:MAG: hypothetical protein NT060_04635 [Candidatus Omnitrophica bacterium]|nr:hypothetical protein [Candidatus Omnitrophota bacterium]
MLQLGLLYADWWNQNQTPVPSNSHKTREEERLIGGSRQHFTYYITDENADAIKSFYRKQLTDSDWQEVDLVSHLPKANADALKMMLIFENNGERIIIVFPPTEAFRDRKTRFTVSRGQIKEEVPDSVDNQLLAKPKKDIAPVFPGAILTNLIETPDAQKASYYCKNGIEELAQFYKNNMALRGWRLVSDTPLEKIPMGGAKNIRTVSKTLIFSNSRNDSCKIGLAQTSFGKEFPDVGGSLTNIMVDYEAKH